MIAFTALGYGATMVAMPLIIDAYNVLHETMPPALAGLDEAGLCVALDRSAFRAQSPVVVCDGRPKPLGVIDSPVHSVELVYSGTNRTADDVIIAMIDAHSAPRRLTIVSTDREIRKAARRRRATSWTSDTFLSKLVEAMGTKPQAAGKPRADDMTPEQIAAWLKQFGFGDADEAKDSSSKEDDDLKGVWPPW